MLAKIEEKALAITLRRKGYTYSEILKEVPVSQASLSLWLRGVPTDHIRIQKKAAAGQRAGARAQRAKRLQKMEVLKGEVEQELPELMKDPLFVSGLSLYWAEGTKQKPWNISAMTTFINSDPGMLQLMKRWFMKYGGATEDDLKYYLHIHEDADAGKAREEWANILHIEQSRIRVTLKRHVSKFRKNTIRMESGEYRGLIGIQVAKSTWLNRRITFWYNGLAEQYAL